LIAGLLPPDTATQVRQLTAGRDLVTLDDMLRAVENPELPRIARILPTDFACQVVRTACTLDFAVSDVLAEVVNTANRSARSPKGARRGLRGDTRAAQSDRSSPAPEFARASFPRPPIATRTDVTPAPSASRTRSLGSRPQLARHAR
jgi:hypothetical protein